jgi:lysophospholipase L1-like esterase
MKRTVLAAFAAALMMAAVAFGDDGPSTQPATKAASVLKPGDRILFIGDSITGLGERNEKGFVHLMRDALKAAHPDGNFELVTLGASGSTVGAWLDFFRRAADPKEKEFTTDVLTNGVKATLAKNWDVVIIMLGMNDVMMPAVNDDEKSLQDWQAAYARLVQTVRDRLHPRVTALAQCTMSTEDPKSAMSKFIDKLNGRVAELAKQSGCLFLATNNEYKSMLAFSRHQRADFHITYDYIHPTAEGHMAIATGMLAGLNDQGADLVRSDCIGPLNRRIASKSPVCRALPNGPDGEGEEFVIYCAQFRGMRLAGGPEGWTGSDLDRVIMLDVKGNPNRRQNVLVIEGSADNQKKRGEVVIPPAWLITSGPIYIWREKQFDEKVARTAIDDAIEAGKDFTAPVETLMHASSVPDCVGPKTTGTLKWHRFFPSVDYTGGDAPGNVDFLSIAVPKAFETGYGARWVRSDKDRPVKVEVSSKGFTGGIYMFVWLNGKKVYSGAVSEQPKMTTTVDAQLKKGWNCLAFRCCHRTYFMQCGVDLLPVGDDKMDDLRYSVVPK